jgi:ankyrin repeat protein
MKTYLSYLLISLAVPWSQSPVHSQTKDQSKADEAQQTLVDDKLMRTLSFGRKGHCDLKAVQTLLQQGASPNARNSDGNTLTALMVASENGCTEIVKQLLTAGAEVNAKAEHVSSVYANVLQGITALSSAAASENATVVRILLEHRADVHARTDNGATVMLYASSNEIAQIFLDHGLDINAHDKHGYTLLIWSAEWEGVHRPSVQYLLEHGADPNAKTDDGTTALKLAQAIGHPDDVELLRKAGAKQ